MSGVVCACVQATMTRSAGSPRRDSMRSRASAPNPTPSQIMSTETRQTASSPAAKTAARAQSGSCTGPYRSARSSQNPSTRRSMSPPPGGGETSVFPNPTRIKHLVMSVIPRTQCVNLANHSMPGQSEHVSLEYPTSYGL